MADIICGKCSVKMQKEKSGLKIKLPNDYCQHGDLFRCPVCGTEVIGDIGRAHPDNNPDKFDIELKRGDMADALMVGVVIDTEEKYDALMKHIGLPNTGKKDG